MKPLIEMNKKYLPALSRIFSPIVMDSLVKNGYSPYLSEVSINSGLLEFINQPTTLGLFFDQVYDYLSNNYRNEYVYKNVIANKILLGKHSLNTSRMLTEFRVGTNKADVVLLNGSSTVYEIKSEYDSFARLEKQIRSYLEMFDYINVVTSSSQVNKLNEFLPNSVGLIVLTNSNKMSTIRHPKYNRKNINKAILFDSLRKAEYMKIIKDHYKITPTVPNTQIYKKCKKMFCEIPDESVFDLTIKTLKKRTKLGTLKAFIEKAPPSVSAYAMSISDEEIKMQKLMALFDIKINSLLNPNIN